MQLLLYQQYIPEVREEIRQEKTVIDFDFGVIALYQFSSTEEKVFLNRCYSNNASAKRVKAAID